MWRLGVRALAIPPPIRRDDTPWWLYAETAIRLDHGHRRRTTAASIHKSSVSVLDLSQEHGETFSLWGIRTLGLLADLPEKALIARMGQEGKRLRQLARGEMPHLLLPLEPSFALEERMELDTAVELLDSLLFVVGVILEQLILRAKAHNDVHQASTSSS